MTETKRVALYARVSTDSQNAENQLLQLRAVAERQLFCPGERCNLAVLLAAHVVPVSARCCRRLTCLARVKCFTNRLAHKM